MIGWSQGGTVAAAVAACLCQRQTPLGLLLNLRSTILAPDLEILTNLATAKLWFVQFVALLDNQYGHTQQLLQAHQMRFTGHHVETVASGISHWDPIDFGKVLSCIVVALEQTFSNPLRRCHGKV